MRLRATRAAAVSAASMLRPALPPLIPLPIGGLLSEWRFTEGSGSTVADSVGSSNINLNLPTTPNFTWTSKGLTLASGLVQTPTIVGARTFVMLFRTGRNQAGGFVMSGGSASGSGVLQDSVSPTYTHHVTTTGEGVRPLLFRASGEIARQINRGGWMLVFVDFNASHTTAIGMGGRHSTTTSRCADFELGWACVYNRALTDSDRADIYAHVRAVFAKPRGIYIHWQDCPTVADLVLISGQSNASGRALRGDLTAPEVARAFSKVYAAAGTNSVRPAIPAGVLSLGSNQTAETPSTYFGPETPLAWSWEDNRPGLLFMCKVSQGSTYLAPSSVGAPVTVATSWDKDEDVAGSLAADLLHDYCDVVQDAASNGIGLRFLAWINAQGEQDATGTAYGSIYQAQLQELSDWVRQYLGPPSKTIVCRIRNMDPAMNATASAQVRAAQAAFVAANAANGAVLIDADQCDLAADGVHYNAQGMRELGAAIYAELP